MGGRSGGKADQGPDPSRRIQVLSSSGRRPFMRGIMVHSLMGRGLSFDDAYLVANKVRSRLEGGAGVSRETLAGVVDEVVTELGVRAELRSSGAAVAPIWVTGPEGANPFSKGFLSQSLLAAAIDPNEAFDAAREIEAALLLRGLDEVDRRELRRRTFETLNTRFGPKTAERYLIWRQFSDPEKPVILLLGGATGSGKTALAVEVAHRLGIHRVMSTDSIRQIMRIMLSPELVPAIHASSYDAHRVVPTAAAEDPVIAGFEAQASTAGVGVQAMSDRAVSENSSLILDGVSLVPGLLDLEPYKNSAYIIFLVVATLDPAAFRARFVKRGSESPRPPHRYLENLDAILKIQDHILEMADRYDVPIVDNRSMDESVLSILKHVTGRLRLAEGHDVDALL